MDASTKYMASHWLCIKITGNMSKNADSKSFPPKSLVRCVRVGSSQGPLTPALASLDWLRVAPWQITGKGAATGGLCKIIGKQHCNKGEVCVSIVKKHACAEAALTFTSFHQRKASLNLSSFIFIMSTIKALILDVGRED